MDVPTVASDIVANSKETETPANLGLSTLADLPSPQPVVLRGRRMLWKEVVSRPPRQPSPPAPKRRIVELTPEKLRRSARFHGGSASSSTNPSSPEIIELDEEEAEVTETMGQPSYDPWGHDWTTAFGMALLQCFESKIFGDATIASMKTAT